MDGSLAALTACESGADARQKGQDPVPKLVGYQ